MVLLATLSTLALVFSTASAQQRVCKILYDGRIPNNATTSDFTRTTSLYDPTYVLGGNQTWAEVLKFPENVPKSLFDTANTKPVTLTIVDKSIFYPNPTSPQTGFRRSELLPRGNNGSDPTVQGKTTVHWSIRHDPAVTFNWTHEYQIVWHERNDYSANHFIIKFGTPFSPQIESIPIPDPKTIRIVGLTSLRPEPNVFMTPFDLTVWHNFALTIDWRGNTITGYYSTGNDPLKLVVPAFSNNNTDGGQFHFGMLKLPTGAQGIDVLHEGYQPPLKPYEGIIYGGIFIEDSADGCVTLAPTA